MYKQRISYADYVEEVERLYKIERREIYFGFVIRDFIQSILTESEQLVAVWDNKGYKDDTKNPLHKRKNYADSHSLQDFIILTDCVTWMFLKKDEPVKDEKVVCLIQEGKWLQMEQMDFNNERMGNIHMKEPEQWDDLVNTIRAFVAEAKKQRKE